jgi:hypothetical protein
LTLLTMACQAQEVHLTEAGSAPVLARSAFAHGYRHGYEAGYHAGNIDANMGRQPKLKKTHVDNTAYSPDFGSRRSFDDGFHAGLQAGYHDGYDGNEFRVVDSVRSLAEQLEPASARPDPSGDFDRGLGSGYNEGFAHGQSFPSSPATLDFGNVGCSSPDRGAFCDGYRRGFVLGRVDALTLRREFILEASK